MATKRSKARGSRESGITWEDLTALQIEHRLSQAHVAMLCRVQPQTVSQWVTPLVKKKGERQIGRQIPLGYWELLRFRLGLSNPTAAEIFREADLPREEWEHKHRRTTRIMNSPRLRALYEETYGEGDEPVSTLKPVNASAKVGKEKPKIRKMRPAKTAAKRVAAKRASPSKKK